jgi:hypothetical protein
MQEHRIYGPPGTGTCALPVPGSIMRTMETRNCTICGSDFQPCKPTSTTCSPKCRNANNSRQSAEKRSKTLRGRGEAKGYVKFHGRHEHRVVAEYILGRELLPGEIVHHKDHNKQNNDPMNLLITTQSDHVARFSLKNRKCSVPGCTRKHYSKNYCSLHYQRHLAGKKVMPNA